LNTGGETVVAGASFTTGGFVEGAVRLVGVVARRTGDVVEVPEEGFEADEDVALAREVDAVAEVREAGFFAAALEGAALLGEGAAEERTGFDGFTSGVQDGSGSTDGNMSATCDADTFGGSLMTVSM
jgi:hypothetical protein